MKSKVTADIKKNRVVLYYRGRITKEVASSMYTDARFCAADLKPGFDIVSDFSECELAHVAAITTMRKIILYLIEKGAGEAVRILKESSLVNKQMINFATWIPGHKPVYVASMEEAEEKLSTIVRRQGIRIHFHEFSIFYMVKDKKYSGSIENISVSGCALLTSEKVPVIGDQADLIININEEKESTDGEIRLQSEVVRTDIKWFAVRFLNLDDGLKHKLFKHVLSKSHMALKEI